MAFATTLFSKKQSRLIQKEYHNTIHNKMTKDKVFLAKLDLCHLSKSNQAIKNLKNRHF